MTDEIIEVATQARSEIDLLKAQADRMGIAYKGNISVTALKAKIAEQLAGAAQDEVEGRGAVEKTPTSAEGTVADTAYYDKALRLIRVIITPIETTKAANLESDVFTVSNMAVGTITRTIPFGREWHVEEILLNSIREKKFQQFTSRKNERGVQVTTARLAPAYNISVLEPLTAEELKALAEQQARTGSIQED